MAIDYFGYYSAADDTYLASTITSTDTYSNVIVPVPQPIESDWALLQANQMKIILYLGRIHQIKGLDLLVESYKKIVDKDNNIVLVIVGPDGGYLSSLKEKIRKLNLDDKVIFTGPLYDIDKLEYMFYLHLMKLFLILFLRHGYVRFLLLLQMFVGFQV